MIEIWFLTDVTVFPHSIQTESGPFIALRMKSIFNSPFFPYYGFLEEELRILLHLDKDSNNGELSAILNNESILKTSSYVTMGTNLLML